MGEGEHCQIAHAIFIALQESFFYHRLFLLPEIGSASGITSQPLFTDVVTRQHETRESAPHIIQ